MDQLKEGDRVRLQPLEPCKFWRPAKVVRPVSHRSYEVKLEGEGVLRRNRRHLRRSHDTNTTPTRMTPMSHTPEAEVEGLALTGQQGSVVTRRGRQVIKPNYLKGDCTQ